MPFRSFALLLAPRAVAIRPDHSFVGFSLPIHSEESEDPTMTSRGEGLHILERESIAGICLLRLPCEGTLEDGDSLNLGM